MIFNRQFSWYESTVINIIGTGVIDKFPTHLKPDYKSAFQDQGVFINFEVSKPIKATFEIIIDDTQLEKAGQYRLNSEMDTLVAIFIKDIKRYQRSEKLKQLLLHG